jgi:ketosteroid isomerase-like protein
MSPEGANPKMIRRIVVQRGQEPEQFDHTKNRGKGMRQSALFSSGPRQTREVQWMAGCIRTIACVITALALLSACATGGAPSRVSVAGAEEAVRSTELKFAKAMADRDFDAFVTHLSRDAVFFDDRQIQHGAAEVSAAWKPLFNGSKAPFSWVPDHVEVLASGDLALSTGPVIVNDKVVGRFNSIWRLEAPHTWRIVFDKGEPVCADAKK